MKRKVFDTIKCLYNSNLTELLIIRMLVCIALVSLPAARGRRGGMLVRIAGTYPAYITIIYRASRSPDTHTIDDRTHGTPHPASVNADIVRCTLCNKTESSI